MCSIQNVSQFVLIDVDVGESVNIWREIIGNNNCNGIGECINELIINIVFIECNNDLLIYTIRNIMFDF